MRILTVLQFITSVGLLYSQTGEHVEPGLISTVEGYWLKDCQSAGVMPDDCERVFVSEADKVDFNLLVAKPSHTFIPDNVTALVSKDIRVQHDKEVYIQDGEIIQQRVQLDKRKLFCTVSSAKFDANLDSKGGGSSKTVEILSSAELKTGNRVLAEYNQGGPSEGGINEIAVSVPLDDMVDNTQEQKLSNPDTIRGVRFSRMSFRCKKDGITQAEVRDALRGVLNIEFYSSKVAQDRRKAELKEQSAGPKKNFIKRLFGF